MLKTICGANPKLKILLNVVGHLVEELLNVDEWQKLEIPFEPISFIIGFMINYWPIDYQHWMVLNFIDIKFVIEFITDSLDFLSVNQSKLRNLTIFTQVN